MRLTVVVPIYNVEKYLRKCIDSIITQTYKSIEIVLVDDGSTDDSGIIADEYAEKYENVCVIHQKNQGLSGARNTGIDICKTELIAFVDSDDYIESDMYEDLVKRLDEKKADISIGGVYREDTAGNKYSVYPQNVDLELSREEALVELNSLKYFNMSFCNVVYKAELFNMAGFGDELVRFPIGKKSEDEYTAHKIYSRSKKVVYTSTPYYHYIQRLGSITQSSKIVTDQIRAAEERIRYYEKYFPHIAYSAKAEYIFACMALSNMCLKKKITCPITLDAEMSQKVHEYIGCIINNKYVRKPKKVQAVLYAYARCVYNQIMKAAWKLGK